MLIKNRQQLLLILAVVAVGLLAADNLVRVPLKHAWDARSKRIDALRKQVEEGTQLLRREQSLRSRWDRMRRNTLPNNTSAAEQQLFKAINNWARNSGAAITSLTPQWKHDADDYMTYQCRIDALGSLAALSRFLYDMEKDPMALRLESVELGARDKDGQQITLGLQISGLVLTSPAP